MDSNNNTSKKGTMELDIRDVVNFLLSKLWIIALVVLSLAIIAYLWTTFFVTEEYQSTTKLFITSTGYADTFKADKVDTTYEVVALYSAVHYEEPAEGLSMNVLVIGIVILILGILAVAYGIISKKQ